MPSAAPLRCGRDHPRLRGDYPGTITDHTDASGSPPPTRGLPLAFLLPTLKVRITPAYAGTTFPYAYALAGVADHPRLRGDYRSPSPRPSAPTRITPAYAGTTRRAFAFSGSRSDHPRLRGDYAALMAAIMSSRGSPPPTRGLPPVDAHLVERHGITPAYAGTTGWG